MGVRYFRTGHQFPPLLSLQAQANRESLVCFALGDT